MNPLRVAWCLLAALAVGCLLGGCADLHSQPGAYLQASCPPLYDPPLRNDSEAQTRRIAEVEGWYKACRDAALNNSRPEPMRPWPVRAL